MAHYRVARMFTALVLLSLTSLAAAGGKDVTYIIRLHENSNTASVELHMRTNALGRIFKSHNGSYIEQSVSAAPLNCPQAGASCLWKKSESWSVVSEENIEASLPRLIHSMKGNFLISSPCDVNNGGCPVYCNMQVDLTASCSCPPGATFNSIRNTCSLDGTPILGGIKGRFSIPSPYSNRMFRSWIIVVPRGHKVKLTFPVFKTEDNCDFVDVHDGLGASGRKLGHFSGSTSPGTLRSSSNAMFVTFYSDVSNARFPGFTAEYTAEISSSHSSSTAASNSVLALNEEEGTLTSPPFVPTFPRLCLSIIHKLTDSSSKLSLSAKLHTGQDVKLTRTQFVEVDDWKIGRYRGELREDVMGHPITVSALLTGNDSALFSIIACNPYVDEDIYVLTDSISLDKVKDPDNSPIINPASPQRCYNGGVFNEAMNECDCPVGFVGHNCFESCGPYKFGEDCGGECSGLNEECYGVIFSKENLPCSCAPGIKGKKCDTKCSPGEYGASCKMRCGQCANGQCDIFTGRCEHGCKAGYVPPLCQDLYPHLSVAPQVSDIAFSTVTVTADLNNVAGTGAMKFYQVQYKERTNNNWMELQPQVSSSKAVTANVTGLRSGVDYDVRIVVINEDGNSFQGSSIPSTELQTLCAVPDSKDYGPSVLTNTASQLVISWKYDILNPTWCPLSGFEVILQYHWQRKRQILSSTGTQIAYADLYPGRRYEVSIRALTEHGNAPFSAVLPVTTADNTPGEVVNLHMTPSGPRELRASWGKPWSTAGKIRHYVVEYQCIRLLACSESCRDSAGVLEVPSPSVVLTGLLPHAQYRVRVACRAAMLGPYRMVHAITDYTESSVAPAASPMPITARSNVSFSVQWLPPDNCMGLNAFLYEYRFELVTPEEEKTILQVGNTKETNATFNDLAPDTQYNVQVYLVTTAAVNTKHKLVIPVVTRATAPDQVRNLTVYKRGRRMIGIRWGPPLRSYGPLKSFTVTYHQQGASDNAEQTEVIAPTRCTGWPDLYCHVINRLQADADYVISVQARNTEVDTDGSKTSVNGTSTESAPAAPTSLRVLNRTENGLVVEWALPNMINGVLRSFLINVEETDRADGDACCEYFPVQELPVRSEEPVYRLEVSGLFPASTLTVSVSGKTVSMGPSVSLTTTTPPEPPVLQHPLEVLPRKSAEGPFNARIKPIVEHQRITSTYLLLVLPPVNTTKPTIWDDELSQKLSLAVNQTFYIAAEYTQDEVQSGEALEFGTGAAPKNGTIGYVEDRVLSPGMYKAGVALVLDYDGAMSVGYIASDEFNVVEHMKGLL